ncbi:MAG TPA: hypothetical protein VNF73_02080 [Candidatus Saccharimonadales bacterium]|nr:hypothetical protein [Candidatus Saccharimonadales bacterium]
MTNGGRGQSSGDGRHANRRGTGDEEPIDQPTDAEPIDGEPTDEPETAEDVAAGAEQANAPAGGSLVELIGELAAADPEIERRPAGQRTEFVIGGIVFATVEGDGAAFRLRSEVAAAASRTPGVRPLPLGPGWVLFHPTRWDRFALDRSIAWWDLARRLALMRG